jgi:methylenetetrahydrofolate--tRNA-(uracil-5-)-methyltransferase
MEITVIGGGLAGCEAAWQLLHKGHSVLLYEKRPLKSTGPHQTGDLAELVCSNSLGSVSETNASGIFKKELLGLGSLLVRLAYECRVPAGQALAVDRLEFSHRILESLESQPGFALIREEVGSLPKENAVVATGPMTEGGLADELSRLGGDENLFFFDAISPIIDSRSLDMNIVFSRNRYDKGDKTAYLNCPFRRDEYLAWHGELVNAERVQLKDFDKGYLFSGCQPIEEIADSGPDAVAFGPLKPVGLEHPETGERFAAVAQLRQENRLADAYNLVGFQTRLTHPEQKRVFRMVPGMRKARFLRLGSMHRNFFVNGGALLNRDLSLQERETVYMAGQMTGAEGYVEAIGTGLLAATNLTRRLEGRGPLPLDRRTVLGGLADCLTTLVEGRPQPMKVNFGILAKPSGVKGKKAIREAQASISERAISELAAGSRV